MKTIRKLAIASILIFGFQFAAMSQESFNFIIDENGNVVRSLLNNIEQKNIEQSDKIEFGMNDQFQDDLFTNTQKNGPIDILNNQDWYVSVDPSGALSSIYTIPSGAALPTDILQGSPSGSAVYKVEPSAFGIGSWLPDEEKLREQLSSFISQTQSIMCGSNATPGEFEATIDVSPAWGFTGKISFTGKWKKEEVCDE